MAKFGFRSTAEEVTEGVDASGLIAIVTGGSSGIGAETVRVLALRGAHVFILSRSLNTATKVQENIRKSIEHAKVDVVEIDLSSLESVRKCAAQFLALNLPLHILINNGGVMGSPTFSLSKDGIELQFATNYVGHFLLTNLLLGKMKETARESGMEGRIINVSSLGHRLFQPKGADNCFDSLNTEDNYSPWLAYGKSKLANILHANHLSTLLKEEGANVTVNSLHPGSINTNLLRQYAWLGRALGVASFFGNWIGLKDVAQGAATQCFLALNPIVKGVSGKYFSNSNECCPSKYATDPNLGKLLWDYGIHLTSDA